MKFQTFNPIVTHLKEPNLLFGENIGIPEPKIGWTLLGPLGNKGKIFEIKIALIGDTESISELKDFLRRLEIKSNGLKNNLMHVGYPGLENLKIKLKIIHSALIGDKEIREGMEKADSLSRRINNAVKIFKDRIESVCVRDPGPDIILISYPKLIDYYCIEQAVGKRVISRASHYEKMIEKKKRLHKTLDNFDQHLVLQTKKDFLELRSALKAISMENNVPIQILRPSTIEAYNASKPKREDDATTFWNLIVALFYKSNNIPWKVENIDENTCYLGVSFFKNRQNISNVKTSLAQVFSLNMDGMVLKGGEASMDDNRSYHLREDDTKRIVNEAIEIFKLNKGYYPIRLVIHKTSRFDKDEIRGFSSVSDKISKIDMVSFGSRKIKMIRWGKHPPLRGTLVKLPDKSILLYTFGYIPYFDNYPGPRVPSPLEILEHHGSTQIEDLCSEILALTRLNWNNAKFCSKVPVTLLFAKRVGNILRECPDDIVQKNKFKFYM